MDMLVEELKRGLEAAYELHMELTQRLIEKKADNDQELMASMEHHVSIILQTFHNCISRLRSTTDTSNIPNTISTDEALYCDIVGPIRQFQPIMITTELKEDGFKWRKYGKKPILSSKYPREYYKCRYSENGCRAFKYVQMICDSPTTKYRVMYSGSHTCTQLLPDSPEILSFCSSSESSNLQHERTCRSQF